MHIELFCNNVLYCQQYCHKCMHACDSSTINSSIYACISIYVHSCLHSSQAAPVSGGEPACIYAVLYSSRICRKGVSSQKSFSMAVCNCGVHILQLQVNTFISM